MRRWTRYGAMLCTALAIWSCQAQAQAPAATGPKRVIVIIGDGTGLGQREMWRLYKYGPDGQASWDKLPFQAFMSTYSIKGSYDPAKVWESVEAMVANATDSAASATVMATGVKTYNGAIGLDNDKQPLVNHTQVAESLGLSSGVVTTVTWPHATPAGWVAHQEKRQMYVEIANEMVHDSAVDVIMGGGHPLMPHSDGRPRTIEEAKFDNVGGRETWEALNAGTAGGDADGDGVPDPWTLVTKRADVESIARGNNLPKRLLVTFESSGSLQVDRKPASTVPFDVPFRDNVPTLADMSRAAMNVLDQNPKGWFLMIEEGNIDSASHGNNGPRVVEEASILDETVQAVVDWVDAHGGWDNTLLIVTGDHETGMLTGPDEDGLFAPLKFNGLGQMPGHAFHTKGHSNSLIPFSARGAGLDYFEKAASMTDPKRGRYLDNSDLGKGVIAFLHAN